MTTTAVAVTFDDMSRLAEAVAKSGLFGMKTADEALALMAIAQAEGQHPALAARDYHIVQKRPVLKASAMLARFQAAGGQMRYIERTDARVVAEFSHPQGGSITVDWDIERAKRAGLAGRDNWKNYPRQMLTARVISEGINAVFPGATGGLMTPEEAIDIPDPEARDVTPAKPLTGVAALKAKLPEPIEAPPPPPPPETAGETPGELTGEVWTYAEVSAAIQASVKAKDTDALLAAVDLIKHVAADDQRASLDKRGEGRLEGDQEGGMTPADIDALIARKARIAALTAERDIWEERAAKMQRERDAAEAEIAALRNECVALLNLSRSEASLLAGEMTAQEWRTVSAILNNRIAAIRAAQKIEEE